MTAKKTETADPGVAVVFARPWTVDGKAYQPDEAASFRLRPRTTS